MPNWCSNKLVLKHKDPAQLERAVNAFNKGELLNEFCPCPEELREAEAKRKTFANAEVKSDNMTKYGFESWYDWSIANWGVKWDVGADSDEYEQLEHDLASGRVELWFNSTWVPPIEGMQQLEKHGFEIELLYWEPGMAFTGKYTTADGDKRYEYGQLTAQQAEDTIPAEVDIEFDFIEDLFTYEKEMEKHGTT